MAVVSGAALGWLLLAVGAGCERARTGGDTTVRAPRSVLAGGQAPTGASTAAAQAPDSAREPFARPVVVFMEASQAEIESARARMPEEDYYVMADDLSFYRSAAYEYLEKRHLPVVRVSGHRPLQFVVDGTARAYDFADATTLDLLVLYDGKRAPHAIAPIDVQMVDGYFEPRSEASEPR